jgi:hypothetical protein
MVYLRNPGPWAFGIIASGCGLVGFLFWVDSPEAVKLAAALGGVIVAGLSAKSALAQAPADTPRPPSESWPRSAEEWEGQEVDVKEIGK